MSWDDEHSLHVTHLSRLIAVMMTAQATWLQLSREEMMVQRVFPNTHWPPRAHWWIRKGMTVTCTRSAPARLHMYTSGTVFLGDLHRNTQLQLTQHIRHSLSTHQHTAPNHSVNYNGIWGHDFDPPKEGKSHSLSKFHLNSEEKVAPPLPHTVCTLSQTPPVH